MPLLRTVAESLSQESMERGVIEEIFIRDPLFALLPFTQISGKAYVYTREKTLAEGAFLDPNEVVPESASDFENVTSYLKIIIGDVDVDKFLDTTMSNINDQKALQIAAKAKGMGIQFRRALLNGNPTANPKEFPGLWTYAAGTQKFAAGAAATNNLTFGMLDDLVDRVPMGADCLMMHSSTLRYYRSMLRAQSGTDAVMVQLDNFGKEVPSHNGVPIIVNDFITGTENVDGTALTGGTYKSVYALRMNEVDGFHGIFGGASGFQVEDLGTVQNKDATRTRLKWYVGTALKSSKSIARLTGVSN